MDYLLIDGNNIAHKAKHAYNLETSEGVDVSIPYGVFDQLIHIRKAFMNYLPLVVWDGGHKLRDEQSAAGVKKGIIKQGYKENRDVASGIDNELSFVQQFLSYTNIPQFRRDGVEADDVIASYCKKLEKDSTVICFTCDHDYYQLISKNTSVVSRRKGEEDIWNHERFTETYGIEPWQWVEVGALSGDGGDNIFGVHSVGEKKALNYIKKHGTAIAAVEAVREDLDPLRAEYKDLASKEDVDKLLSIVQTNKVQPYEGCHVDMPFSGVALAIEEKRIKKCNKTDVKLAMYKERVQLAHKLKGMYCDLDLPDIKFKDSFDEEKFFALCRKLQFVGIPTSVSYLKEFP